MVQVLEKGLEKAQGLGKALELEKGLEKAQGLEKALEKEKAQGLVADQAVCFLIAVGRDTWEASTTTYLSLYL